MYSKNYAKNNINNSNTGNNKLWNPMEIKWSEVNSEKINYIWNKIPWRVQPVVVTLCIFIFGISLKGEWLIAVVHVIKHWNQVFKSDNNYTGSITGTPVFLTSQFYEDFLVTWIVSNFVAYSVYFLVGGFLHWYFYVKQRHCPEKWKCQPDRWLSPELELDEIFYGSISLLVTNTYSALLTSYVRCGGSSCVYYQFDEYSWTWWFLQWPVIFFTQDYLVYLLHRLYHTPYLYKKFHKLHHKYKQPTAFSVTAIHPVEILHIQIVLCLLIFFIPVHYFPFYSIAFYTYFNGIIDHSGIDFKAPWWQPWRPDTIFHDNHHQYFHVNFSFNCYFWDKLHGTYRKNDRIYNEDIFYGKGKPLSEASEKEIKVEENERKSENPKAHRKIDNYVLPDKFI
ncbi:putative methylsterol monooxygenase DDB_G0269788 [Lycorma delicatula]|uniref:putative methylsterol monooxygenase DDB_G0269788 n=1 Tax=Lycorma delicatula TaxID=130591 RepID=UPI003F51435B